MLPFEDRYTRQRQLREVGLAGQARLEQSRVNLGTSPPDLYAAEYLTRAGVQVAQTSACPASEVNTELQATFMFSGPAAVAGGALLALDHIKSALGLPAEGSTPQSKNTVARSVR